MKLLKLDKNFKKNYDKRIFPNEKLRKQAEERTSIFLINPKDHVLKGNMKPKRSFSVSGDIRIIYLEYKNHYLFLDIGSHNQVY